MAVREIDWIGLVVRFGCGAGFGALAGMGCLQFEVSTGAAWMIVVGAAIACGLLAAVYGDGFWQKVIALLFWWV